MGASRRRNFSPSRPLARRRSRRWLRFVEGSEADGRCPNYYARLFFCFYRGISPRAGIPGFSHPPAEKKNRANARKTKTKCKKKSKTKPGPHPQKQKNTQKTNKKNTQFSPRLRAKLNLPRQKNGSFPNLPPCAGKRNKKKSRSDFASGKPRVSVVAHDMNLWRQ